MPQTAKDPTKLFSEDQSHSTPSIPMSEKVRAMFADISHRYDVINRVLSLGVDRYWRRVAVKESGASKGDSVLDCATGTGDLALSFKRRVGESGAVLGTDFCAEMIAFGPGKAEKTALKVDFEVADAMDLPYKNDRFDVASIAFGIRNVDDPVVALKEMARVVKPGGRVMVLEFGQPKGLFGYLFRFYSRTIMPAVGGWLSGNRDAYTYLPETSARFPAGDSFLSLMDQTGSFVSRRSKSLTGGIAYVYIGVVQ